MFRRALLGCLLLWVIPLVPAYAQGRFIVRVLGGLPVAQTLCSVLNCQVGQNLDGPIGQLFLVTTPPGSDPTQFLTNLLNATGVINAEADAIANAASTNTAPPALSDTTPINYFGAIVPHGYVSQPAMSITRLSAAQSGFRVAGSGLVAVIDTGVDLNHPALAGVLVPGYDFTRNTGGGDEVADLPAQAIVGATPSQLIWTNPNSAAEVSQSTAAVVDGNPGFSDFGHGTMVAGIIHLVAPQAKILPLKAFHADGTGYNSDIIRAIYYAITQRANVINMSFSLAGYSQEVQTALGIANLLGSVCVAAAGNNATNTLTYPAAYPNVMGVASTNNEDQLSAFSNYGSADVWVGAPGEAIVTTYPLSTYAAGWGTSFSAPFVSGTAALMLSVRPLMDQYQGAQAVAHAQPEGSLLDNGRLDGFQALQAWAQLLGLLGL